MEISIFWNKPLPLIDGSQNNLIYTVAGLGDFEEVSGVYMFCRVYKEKISPRYIGKALNLAARIRQQLNTTKLVRAIERQSLSGAKVLVIGELLSKPGQVTDKCIRLVEKALIEHALAEGHELINQKGTKTPYDEIAFAGNVAAKNFTGPQIYLKKSRG
jgi:hypothetical protein